MVLCLYRRKHWVPIIIKIKWTAIETEEAGSGFHTAPKRKSIYARLQAQHGWACARLGSAPLTTITGPAGTPATSALHPHDAGAVLDDDFITGVSPS